MAADLVGKPASKNRRKRRKTKSIPVTDSEDNKLSRPSTLFSLQAFEDLELDSEKMEGEMNRHDEIHDESNKNRQIEAEAEPEPKGFKGEEDFIALLPSSDDDEDEENDEPEQDYSSTKARGKRRERSRSPEQSYRSSDSRAPWCDGLRLARCRNVAELLHKEVLAFTNYMSPTSHEDAIRAMVVSLISRAITSYFPDAKIEPFGSFSTKLYLPSGDIDLVAFSDTMAVSHKDDVLHGLAGALKQHGITHKVQIIAKAKVPIVKFVTKSSLGAFHVDVSINQLNGLEALKIIKAFLGEDEAKGGMAMGMALRALVLVTKQFLSQRSMNEVYTGGLGSYSIVCLAISFLQMHPKIRNGHINPSHNLGVLLIEFFELYGVYFNYEQVGISLRNGGCYYNKSRR